MVDEWCKGGGVVGWMVQGRGSGGVSGVREEEWWGGWCKGGGVLDEGDRSREFSLFLAV